MHWATFDADETADYNRENCELAARLLNEYFREYRANYLESLERVGGEPSDFYPIGLWCERGRYRESGPVPLAFNAD